MIIVDVLPELVVGSSKVAGWLGTLACWQAGRRHTVTDKIPTPFSFSGSRIRGLFDCGHVDT